VPHSSNSNSCWTSFCSSVIFYILTEVLTCFRHFACFISKSFTLIPLPIFSERRMTWVRRCVPG
jgi:hypothetical protein